MQVSIVIASNAPAEILGHCLDSLMPQALGHDAEIIIVDSRTGAAFRKRFLNAAWLPCPQPANLARMRAAGIAEAKGDVIAILDPYAIPRPDWLSELVRAHRSLPNLAIGGGVDMHLPESKRLGDWAVYLNEYGAFLDPVREGAVHVLPGCNIAYKRAAIADAGGAAAGQPGFWKAFVNFAIEAGDHALWLAPGVRVELEKPIPYMDFLNTRFYHGRCFAGMRSAGLTFQGRMLRGLTAFLLPFVFQFRSARAFLPKRRYLRKYLASLPGQFLLHVSWSLGEVMGYFFGPGSTCDRLVY